MKKYLGTLVEDLSTTDGPKTICVNVGVCKWVSPKQTTFLLWILKINCLHDVVCKKLCLILWLVILTCLVLTVFSLLLQVKIIILRKVHSFIWSRIWQFPNGTRLLGAHTKFNKMKYIYWTNSHLCFINANVISFSTNLSIYMVNNTKVFSYNKNGTQHASLEISTHC